jgi:hypothetical protein
MPVMPLSQYHGTGAVGVSNIEIVHEGPLKPDDVIFTFTAEPESNVNPIVALSIGIDDPSCEGRECMDVLNGIGREVGEILDAFVSFFST